jgi:hypothetical protein
MIGINPKFISDIRSSIGLIKDMTKNIKLLPDQAKAIESAQNAKYMCSNANIDGKNEEEKTKYETRYNEYIAYIETYKFKIDSESSKIHLAVSNLSNDIQNYKKIIGDDKDLNAEVDGYLKEASDCENDMIKIKLNFTDMYSDVINECSVTFGGSKRRRKSIRRIRKKKSIKRRRASRRFSKK